MWRHFALYDPTIGPVKKSIGSLDAISFVEIGNKRSPNPDSVPQLIENEFIYKQMKDVRCNYTMECRSATLQLVHGYHGHATLVGKIAHVGGLIYARK
jgi:hypothetical protein